MVLGIVYKPWQKLELLTQGYTSQTILFKKYEDEEYPFSLCYPVDWQHIESPIRDSLFLIKSVSFFPQESNETETKIIVEVEPLDNIVTLDDYIKHFEKAILENEDRAKILNTSPKVMSHRRAIRLLYELRRNGKMYRKSATISLNKKTAYIFYYESTPDKFLKFINLENKILNSLNISSHLESKSSCDNQLN